MSRLAEHYFERPNQCPYLSTWPSAEYRPRRLGRVYWRKTLGKDGHHQRWGSSWSPSSQIRNRTDRPHSPSRS